MKKKYVLITGSSRGIGRACAVAFAKNGYHVFINCKNSVEQLAETEHEILACPQHILQNKKSLPRR